MALKTEEKFEANLTARINGAVVTLNGAGFRDETNGLVEGNYQISDIPEGFHPLLLNAFLITGYPSETRITEGAMNPFKGVSYGYSRRVTFLEGTTLAFKAQCIYQKTMGRKEGSTIFSEFDLNGEVHVPDLVEVEPLVETWVPVAPGRVIGTFTMVWRAQDGRRVVGNAVTEYILPTSVTMPKTVQHRWIHIKSTGKGKKLFRHQESVLWAGNPIPQHK